MGLSLSKQNEKIEDLNTQIDVIKPVTIDRSDEIQELREQLKELKSIDKNRDNVITRDEIDTWLKNQNTVMEDFKQKIKEDLLKEKNIENEAKYIELQKRIKSLESINASLEKKLGSGEAKKNIAQHEIKDKIVSVNPLTHSALSHEQIDIFVERLLSDTNVNIAYLPDYVERQLYRNFISIFLGVIQNLTDTTEIKFLGHKISLQFVPDKLDSDNQSKNHQ